MKNKEYNFWDQNRGIIRSRNGGWIPGKGVFCHGHNLLEELVGSASYFQILILNATGRLVEKRLADWFEALFGCLSWPDPRIWCNQIGALSGTLRASPTAATVAGILATDSRAYGGAKTTVEGINFISKALKRHNEGFSPAEIVYQECKQHGGKPNFMGYARPIAKGDERIAALENVSEKLGFPIGEHLKLAYEIEKVLIKDFDEGMNINGYICAFMADQGISAAESYRINTIVVASGVTACYVDAVERPPESFLPMRCEDFDYQGKPPRTVAPREES